MKTLPNECSFGSVSYVGKSLFCLVLRQQDVQQDGNHGGGNDAGAAEDQLHSLGSEVQNGGIGAHTVANAQRYCHDGQVAAGEGLLGDQLDTADDDEENIMTAAPPRTA